jgi:hypothetical protein
MLSGAGIYEYIRLFFFPWYVNLLILINLTVLDLYFQRQNSRNIRKGETFYLVFFLRHILSLWWEWKGMMYGPLFTYCSLSFVLNTMDNHQHIVSVNATGIQNHNWNTSIRYIFVVLKMKGIKIWNLVWVVTPLAVDIFLHASPSCVVASPCFSSEV